MAPHWTYSDPALRRDLEQGDILRLDDEGLQAILRQVHPHFCDSKYRGFMVTTQTCDLALRSGTCSARYVNIVVIRALADVLMPLLDTVCEAAAEGIYYDDKKRDAKQLLERVFNQNEAALGLFYLHPDAEVGIVEPCVALLRVGIALRVDHYQVIRNARCGSLSPQFQDKLGWMVGNLYSRVAVGDWHEQPNGKSVLSKMVESAVESRDPAGLPRWVKRQWVDAARREGVDIGFVPPTRLQDVLEQHRPPTPPEQAIEQVTRAVKAVLPWVCTEEMRKIVGRLQNDPIFHASFKSADSD